MGACISKRDGRDKSSGENGEKRIAEGAAKIHELGDGEELANNTERSNGSYLPSTIWQDYRLDTSRKDPILGKGSFGASPRSLRGSGFPPALQLLPSLVFCFTREASTPAGFEMYD